MPMLPSRPHYHSASGCPGLPIMHRWGYRGFCHSFELPDAAFGSGHNQRGQRESPPERGNKEKNNSNSKTLCLYPILLLGDVQIEQYYMSLLHLEIMSLPFDHGHHHLMII